MSNDEILQCIFDLANRLEDGAERMRGGETVTRDETIVALVCEFVALEIRQSFADAIDCDGNA